MAIGRKGVVFTLMSIVIVVFLVSSQNLISPPTSSAMVDTEVANIRVSLLDSFVDTVETHAIQSLQTAGYSSLMNLSNEVFLNGWIVDVNSTVNDCIVNNDINGIDCLPESHQITTSMDKLGVIAAEELSVRLDYDVIEVWVTEENPLEVVFWMEISYNVSDDFAKWEMPNQIIKAPVSAEGVFDPLYMRGVAIGRFNNNRSFSLTEFRPTQFNQEVFDQFYYNMSYIARYGAGPSILQRYEGKVTSTSDCCGIESVLNHTDLVGLGLPSHDVYVNYSMVDHQFSSHLMGLIPDFNCLLGEVSKLDRRNPVGYVSFDTWKFDNPYNLSHKADHNTDDCAWY